MLEEFQKEASLQEHLIDKGLHEINSADPEACRQFIRRVAEIVSTKPERHRWGHFTDEEDLSIVYSNMGSNNVHVLDRYKCRLESLQIRYLAVAVWPEDTPHTWAVLIADPNGEDLQELAVECWRKAYS